MRDGCGEAEMLKKAILCVDDEAMILESLKEQLKRGLGSDYRIEVAESGEEALKILDELTQEQIEVPIVISDHIMPGMNGKELLSKVQARFPETLNIFLTGRADADAVGSAVNSASLYRYIPKPWDAGDLHLTISEALRSYFQEKALKEQREALQDLFDHAQKEIAERKRTEAVLEEHLQLQMLISDLSAMFVNVAASEVDGQIELGLKRIVEFLSIDRSSFGEYSEDMKELRVCHSHAVPGIEPVPELIVTDLLPWYANKIKCGEIIAFERPSDLPEEASAEKAYCQRTGLKSNLGIPVAIGDSLVCGLAFGSFRTYRSWPDDLVQQLKRVAEVFAHARYRKRAEEKLSSQLQKLQESHHEIKQLRDRLQLETDYLREEIKVSRRHGEIVGQSAAMRHVLSQVEQVAPTNSSVLIQGETGAGKELIAHAIHNFSPRRHHVMVKVNCASLPGTLIESELFGREKGAYTGALTKQVGRFEVAEGSTIFLDEIGELSLELQAKLLRVLHNGEFERLGSSKTVKVDVRVIAATNRNLSEEVQKGHFREDLYYRLNVFPIEVPPLRERQVDIPELVWTFVREYGEKMGKKINKISKSTMEDLQRYSWPGNIRELRNVIERAMIISPGNTLSVQIPAQQETGPAHFLTMEEMEASYIKEVLEKTKGRIKGKNGAAAILGLYPSTLYSRMKKLGISAKNEKNG
jgi:DNA-binding NtrC family response regulator